ncbi:glucose dehydrogenase [FAD, quinone]-like [Aricia agestis]|uniref:glucose dehydrogenase [FAD, quinone]-like n=1 Tax=Aricia agestis TaxID=91739 RepID=UPI001C205852|nr:glucose dehydrogenase [FAD, quinone]-like [Aricia agestis]XP_041971499.1 glucose dehydrogenase [FAD, quinone]-like [Aricia agestis]
MIRGPESCVCPIQEVGPAVSWESACYTSTVVLFMSILESYINGRCDLADPCNRVKNADALEAAYDFVVAGGGTSGAVVAGRLSENPQWKVLLIEAGGDEPTASSVPAFVTAYWGRNDTDWNYVTVPQEHACLSSGGVCSWPRGKMLGGCSTINGMMYMRGNPADYDGWAVNGATGWSWFEVLPYFLRSEDNKEIGRGVSGNYHTKGGPMPVQKFRYAPRFAHDVVSAGIELGFPPTSDLNGETSTGFTIAQTFNDGGSRYSTARGFLRPASKRQNLHVLLNAHVSRVVIDPASKRVTGVEYIKNGIKSVVGVKKEAILSAGTLNSPQILLLSGIGPKETLDRFNIPVIKDLPGVGQNLQNHVGVGLEFILNKEPDVPELSWQSAMDYMLNRNGPMSGTGLSQLTGKVNSRLAPAGGRSPDIQMYFSGYNAGCGDGNFGTNFEDKRTVSISVVALQPRSRGYLTLQSGDPLTPPLMQPNYFLDEHEVEVLVDGARIAYRLANTTIMREKYGMEPIPGYASKCPGGGPNPTDDYFRCLAKLETAPENHQVGTCKMGAKDDVMAVVDSQLRVYGVEGLRVVDASIMPTLPSGNTAAPCVMIGERGAEFIMTRHQLFKNKFGADKPTATDDSKKYGEHDSNWAQWDKNWNDNKGDGQQWDRNEHDNWDRHPYYHGTWHTKNQVKYQPSR